MKISNNNLKIKDKSIEKIFLDKKRFEHEVYFYRKFKNNRIHIPKILKIKKNKIIFKKYRFKKVKSQQIFFNHLINFLKETNKKSKYRLNAKERLKSYNDLHKQVLLRYNKFLNIKINKKYLKKFNDIKCYLKKIIFEKHKDTKLYLKKDIISQSDVGFHNCGEYHGKIFFYDFEYAGIDNPIKLICDTYYQPEEQINIKNIRKFISNFKKEFNFILPSNFHVFEKLYKAKMILIILNIFIDINNKFSLKITSETKLKKLQLERLNKAYRYIKIPYIYEKY